MYLTRTEIRTLLATIESATGNENEYIRCHTPRHGKPDAGARKVIKTTQAFINRMRRLRVKLTKHLQAIQGTKP